MTNEPGRTLAMCRLVSTLPNGKLTQLVTWGFSTLCVAILACAMSASIMGKAIAADAQPSKESSAELAQVVQDLWRNFPGRTGIAILAQDGELLATERGEELFPQQSVSKLWVALRILALHDKGQLPLGRQVTVTRNDLVVFNQPLRKYLGGTGSFEMPVSELLEHQITASDNLANNVLLRVGGGPQAVRSCWGECRAAIDRDRHWAVGNLGWNAIVALGR